MSRRRFVALITAGATLALLAATTTALGGFAAGHYTWDDAHPGACQSGSANNRADPVTEIFYDTADRRHVVNHIKAHTGWGNPGAADGQYFRSHTVCTLSGPGLASCSGNCDRFHIRYAETSESDPNLGITSTGTPHHEYYNWPCGHFVDGNNDSVGGYVRGRNELDSDMSAGGHAVVTGTYWGNTQHFLQSCNNNIAAYSDGWVTEIRIPGSLHQRAR